MRFAKTTRMNHSMAAVGLAAGLTACISGAAGDRTPVREKIQFSSPGEAVDAPTALPQDRLLLSRPFEFLERGNSISGVVEPLVAPAPAALPNYSLNARLLEALDRKKNWIYLRSEDVERDQKLGEIFGLRDSSRSDKKPRTALEIFFEDRGQRPTRDRAREAAGAWNRTDAKRDYGSSLGDRTGADANSRFDNPFDSTRTLTAGFLLPGDFSGILQSQGPLRDFRNRGLSDSLSSGRDGRDHADEFPKLLAVPGAINPLAPGFDPINLQLDATGQALNPVTAQRSGALPPAGDVLNPLRSVNESIGSPSSLLGDPSARVLGQSSLSPAVAAPTETPHTQPKPTVTEFPRRKS